ncbi:hypothetical protein ACQP0U_20320 [Micromonospora sp. CA-269861]|uniref:hypothetical protein n=1 Tax=Micromonospora sp. CA-269861 TaxID=3239968 RepID=UPI003D92D649
MVILVPPLAMVGLQVLLYQLDARRLTYYLFGAARQHDRPPPPHGGDDQPEVSVVGLDMRMSSGQKH